MEYEVIKKDIENWIVNYLDTPSKAFNNIKPCPFAKKAWFNNNVKLVLGGRKEARKEIEQWSDEYELVIIACDILWQDIDTWEERMNEVHSKNDLYIMVFDPNAEENCDPDLDEEVWGSVTDEDYGMIFVQRLQNLNDHSEFLDKLGYYDKCPDYFKSYIEKRRMSDGRNEKSKEESKESPSYGYEA